MAEKESSVSEEDPWTISLLCKANPRAAPTRDAAISFPFFVVSRRLPSSKAKRKEERKHLQIFSSRSLVAARRTMKKGEKNKAVPEALLKRTKAKKKDKDQDSTFKFLCVILILFLLPLSLSCTAQQSTVWALGQHALTHEPPSPPPRRNANAAGSSPSPWPPWLAFCSSTANSLRRISRTLFSILRVQRRSPRSLCPARK